MEKTKVSTVPHSFIQPHFDIVASLTLLLDRSALTNDVKKHCNTALKVVGIIYVDAAYHTGTHLLSRKEFDDFFELFPEPFFNNRGLIPIDIIVQNIKKCIETDKILRFNS
jgi:hypothetical protein